MSITTRIVAHCDRCTRFEPLNKPNDMPVGWATLTVSPIRLKWNSLAETAGKQILLCDSCWTGVQEVLEAKQ